GIHTEAVVLRSDFNPSGQLVADRMIDAVMSELELVGLAAQGQSEHLVSEADSEDRSLADQLADVLRLALQGLVISRAVREEHAVGIEREDFFRAGQRRDDRDFAAMLHESAQDVVLDSEIVGDNMQRRLIAVLAALGTDDFRRRHRIESTMPLVA